MDTFKHTVPPILISVIIIIALVVIRYIHDNYPSIFKDQPTVYYAQSGDEEHDVEFMAVIEGADVIRDNWCREAEPLVDSAPDDITISGRSDSYTCAYNSSLIPSIAVMGWGNASEHVTEHPDNSITITHGGPWSAYGSAVDYYVPAGSLSEAMPLMANMLLQINAATSTSLTVQEFKDIFNASSPGMHTEDDKDYGMEINMELALEYAVNGIPAPPPPEFCNNCGWIPATITYILSDE